MAISRSLPGGPCEHASLVDPAGLARLGQPWLWPSVAWGLGAARSLGPRSSMIFTNFTKLGVGRSWEVPRSLGGHKEVTGAELSLDFVGFRRIS